MITGKKNITFKNRLYIFFRLLSSYFLLVIFLPALVKCGKADPSPQKGMVTGNQKKIEFSISELPDTMHIRQLINTGIEKRKTNNDSALACFTQAIQYCLPVIENGSIDKGKKEIYSAFYFESIINSGLVHYFICDYDSAMQYFQLAHQMAEKAGNQLLLAESLFYIAEVHLELGNFEKAHELYTESEAMYRICGDALSVFHCYNSKGILWKIQGDYKRALEYYDKAFALADSLKNERSKADIYNNIGNVYKSRGEFARAMENFDLANRIFTRLNESLRLADCLNNMGDVNKETGNYHRAISYYKNAFEIAENSGDNYRKTGICKNLGEVYTIISDFGQAGYYFNLAVSLAESIGDRVRLAACYKDYGRFYEKQGAFQSAFESFKNALALATEFNNRKEIADINLALANNTMVRGNVNDALVYAENSLAIANEIGAIKEKNRALKILSDIYLSKGDSAKAFIYFRAFSEVKDTLTAISQLETIENIEARYLLNEKENENLVLKAESETRLQKLKLNKTIAFAFAAGLVLLGFIIFLLYKRILDSRILYRQKEEINRRKVQELNNEIDFKNRELTSKALHLVQKDEMIGNISERLHGISGGNGNANREIKSIIWEMKSDIQKNNWNEFEHHFLKVHPDFYHRLQEKFPSLTANEKKICAFLKLNLKTKEISSITGQSIKSIEVARTRLRSRFNLATDENLNAFIGSF
jgi:tetratricopeptide (TPR) repeat protein